MQTRPVHGQQVIVTLANGEKRAAEYDSQHHQFELDDFKIIPADTVVEWNPA